VGTEATVPGTDVTDAAASQSPAASRVRAPKEGNLAISELAADRPAAPSPFGDDQTFPLPVEDLTYTPTTTP
jgi:hypothetical protein